MIVGRSLRWSVCRPGPAAVVSQQGDAQLWGGLHETTLSHETPWLCGGA